MDGNSVIMFTFPNRKQKVQSQTDFFTPLRNRIRMRSYIHTHINIKHKYIVNVHMLRKRIYHEN